MSRSHIIDEAYRLRPEDLTGRPLRAVVANVTMQGLEATQPVLHFANISKRLVLTEAQSRSLIDIAGTAALRNWIGVTVELRTASVGGQQVIEIHAPQDPQTRRAGRGLVLSAERRQWLFSLIIVVAMLALSAFYVWSNWTEIAAVLSALLGTTSPTN